MKLNFPFRPWVSYTVWVIGPISWYRWYFYACLLAILFSVPLSWYLSHEAALVDAEVETVLSKIKNKRVASNRQISQNSAGNSAKVGNFVQSAYLSREQESLMELRLPPVQATKASPLGKYLSDSKLKGVTLKQVDYIWSKAAVANNLLKAEKPTGQNLGVGRIDVSLNLEGSYPAVRAWLGALLYEESNIQINSAQFQRLSRDSTLVSSAILLSVYFQEAR
jgi:hypothetical protein